MELIPGEIYFLNSSAGWVFKFERYEPDPDDNEILVIPSHVIYSKDKNYKQQCNLTHKNSDKIKHATAEQKAHLQACIDAGQYVEPPKLLSYDIF